ncbi:MAG: hypothetical protein ACYDH1_08595 [Anaerolineaceae bacterium]
MNNKPDKKSLSIVELLPILFFAGRILLFLALIPNDLHGFGDFQVYYDIAAIPGLPFFQYWSEYPPVYAWTIEFIYFLSSGNQFIFDFILYLLLTIAGSVSIWQVAKISELLFKDESKNLWRVILYFGFLAFNSYTWWYFDLIPVALMLLAIYAVLKGKDTMARLWLGIGILAKWFPILLLPAIFRFKERKTFLKIAGIAIGMTVIVWGIHILVSPTMTLASLQSQPSRSSWQTFWALIDGNMTTGAFVPMEERIWPEAATFPRGNPSIIPSWATLLVFGGLGFWILLKTKLNQAHSFLSMIGITWALFLLWSIGWSPQWILYVLPLIVLTLPLNAAILFAFGISLITFIEWPFLLSHRIFEGLWLVVPIRLILLTGMILQWYKQIRRNSN